MSEFSIGVGDGRDDLRACRLGVFTALEHGCLSAALGVEELAEHVDFPAHLHRYLVELVHFSAMGPSGILESMVYSGLLPVSTSANSCMMPDLM